MATGEIDVTVIKVIDPRTVLVGPSLGARFEDGHGTIVTLAGEATVTLHPDSDIVTPAQGECGYDEALAFATQFFSENPTEAQVDRGDFFSSWYFSQLTEAGFASTSDDRGGAFSGPLYNAKNAKAGVWTLCPGFGE